MTAACAPCSELDMASARASQLATHHAAAALAAVTSLSALDLRESAFFWFLLAAPHSCLPVALQKLQLGDNGGAWPAAVGVFAALAPLQNLRVLSLPNNELKFAGVCFSDSKAFTRICGAVTALTVTWPLAQPSQSAATLFDVMRLPQLRDLRIQLANGSIGKRAHYDLVCLPKQLPQLSSLERLTLCLQRSQLDELHRCEIMPGLVWLNGLVMAATKMKPVLLECCLEGPDGRCLWSPMEEAMLRPRQWDGMWAA